MPKIIIADTSCFIILAKIGELDLLQKLSGEIFTTLDVVIEYGDTLPSWVTILSVKDKLKQQILENQIDKGESSAIALALELPGSIVVLDDNKARKIARQLQIKFTGTLGLIVTAKLKGVIPSIKPLLQKIKNTNFRVTDELEILALKEAKEF